MKNLIKILIILILIFAAGQNGFSQTTISGADSTKLGDTRLQNAESDDQETQGNMYRQQGNGNKPQSGNKNTPQTVKRIKGSRPDMTKARGARPPMVVRPSGSGIPKGVGKPGGAGRKMGR